MSPAMSPRRPAVSRLIVYALVFLFLFGGCLFFLGGCSGGKSAGVVAARVNGEEIMNEELEKYLNLVYLYWPDFTAGEQIETLKEQMLWLLIESKVLAQELERLGLEVDEEETRRIAQGERDELVQTVYFTEEIFKYRLRELGLDEEDLLTIPRHTYSQEMLFYYLGDEVTEEDAQSFIQDNPIFLEQPSSVYVFHIQLETEEEAMEVFRLLEEGADFLELGRERSKGQNVELGLVHFEDSMDPLFLEAAFALTPGGISSPVETSDGFHIIKVTEKNEARTLTFAQIRDEAIEMLKMMRYNDYLEQLFEDILIETF